jgi:hypothetical protein
MQRTIFGTNPASLSPLECLGSPRWNSTLKMKRFADELRNRKLPHYFSYSRVKLSNVDPLGTEHYINFERIVTADY